MHSVFLYHAIRAGMSMGIVNAGQLGDLRGDRAGAARAGRGRDPEPARRCDRAAARDRRAAIRGEAGTEASRGSGVAQLARGQAARARAGARHRRIRHRGHRGGAQPVRAAAGGDRRPADGRHERGRRPVRRGQDVPAAGGEIGARDEEGGRAPDALHRGGEGSRRPAMQAPTAASSWRRSRATCTTSARTSSASCSSATTSR